MEVTYDSFVESHGPSLKGSGVPEIFWPVLLQKLAGQIFDAGEDFGLAENESKTKGFEFKHVVIMQICIFPFLMFIRGCTHDAKIQEFE